MYPPGAWLFVTWHLHGSLPRALYPPARKLTAGAAFVWIDRYLDTTREGPMFLRNPAIADAVLKVIHYGAEAGYYDLRAFALMANHVHAVLRLNGDASRILQWLKGVSAREANAALGRTGQPFWQRESYDHWVRDHRELQRIVAYVENNPVRAGLVADPANYRRSSAWGAKRGLKPTPAR